MGLYPLGVVHQPTRVPVVSLRPLVTLLIHMKQAVQASIDLDGSVNGCCESNAHRILMDAESFTTASYPKAAHSLQ